MKPYFYFFTLVFSIIIILGNINMFTILFFAIFFVGSLIMMIRDALKKQNDRPYSYSESSRETEISTPRPRAKSNTYEISPSYYNHCKSESEDLKIYLGNLQNIDGLIAYLNDLGGLEEVDKMGPTGGFNPRLFFFFIYDLTKCYIQLGHTLTPRSKEIVCLALLLNKILSPGKTLTLKEYCIFRYDGIERLISVLGIIYNSNDPEMTGEYDFYMPRFFKDFDPDRIAPYMTMLYRYASFIAKADGTVTKKESDYLAGLMKDISASDSNASNTDSSGHIKYFIPDSNDTIVSSASSFEKTPEKPQKKKQQQLPAQTSPDEQLKSLIGLESAKKEVNKLSNFIKIQQLRETQGLKTPPISYHCVFTGNPGTGKTTVARIIASIYKSLGILKKGHLVETDRSGLVAEYVGQTAVKTNKIIDSALDGVLFIDEAYSLVQGGSGDYGMEAIATLLKRMEDDRKRLVVILAGYGDEMKQFIDSNPGLQSRFNRYIHFDDYTSGELLAIYDLNLKKCEYNLAPDARMRLQEVIDKAVEDKDANFGNARYVRNLFEKTLENQASRLASLPGLDKAQLQLITAADIPSQPL